MENAIAQLESLDKISRWEDSDRFGENNSEKLFNVSLELSITWINRILFLKSLEAQLIAYHQEDRAFAFLNLEKVKNYDDLNRLFFSVLARKHEERQGEVKEIFTRIPYLNSSLFEPTELEHDTIFMSNLRDEKIPIFAATVLKDSNGKKRSGEINALEYLFEFLNAYDFSSEGSEEIQEENKTLINAAVLGLIFEKINGYQDGSFFTPSFITMYMCRETIRRAVLQKFNEVKGWDCENLEEQVYNRIKDKAEANAIINSLKICDPAVGSGHFLVSVLNEIIAIKSELKILCDREGKTLRDYQIEVSNDELIITDDNGKLFEYNPKSLESQRIQETLFHEKQTIIENCLFGVDINVNSVKICRLRLWIELLKNAYYRRESNYRELETLPNIDINIKCGNSLISRFALDADLRFALKKNKSDVEIYRNVVQTYRNAENKAQKREMERLMTKIKGNFRQSLFDRDPKKKRLRNLESEVNHLENQLSLFAETKVEKNARDKKIVKLKNDLNKLTVEIEEIESGKIYTHAFEWRFEFPEVLDNKGDFLGFDAVIGNPPWGTTLTKSQKLFLKKQFKEIDSSTPNTFAYFIGLSLKLSRSFVTQLLPDSLLVKDFAKTRKFLSHKVNLIHWYQNTGIPEKHRPFLDVEHDVCSIFISPYLSNECLIETRRYQKSIILQNSVIRVKSDFILQEYDYVYNLLLTNIDISILLKLRDLDTLDKYFQCHEGIHSGNIRKKLFTKSNNSKLRKPMFLGAKNGDNIQNYLSQTSGWYVNYDRKSILKEKKEYASLRDERIFALPKIYITRTGNQFKAFIDMNTYASNNFFSIQFKDYAVNSYKNLISILGLLNSRFANYYIRKIIAPSLGDTFIETKIIHLLKLPFNADIINNIEMSNLVHRILEAKKADPKANISSLEKEIDRMIYALYGLTEEEIKIVEGETC